MSPVDRDSLTRSARASSGTTSVRISKAVLAALHLFSIPRDEDQRRYWGWGHVSVDDKLAYLLLTPKLSTETLEIPVHANPLESVHAKPAAAPNACTKISTSKKAHAKARSPKRMQMSSAKKHATASSAKRRRSA